VHKREGFGLPLSKLLALLGRMLAKTDQPSFIRVHHQFELTHLALGSPRTVRASLLVLKVCESGAPDGTYSPASLPGGC
jgi:hypothetical protein